ncbi:MAG: ATP-grasp domain-containing protein [Arenicellales bacterium]
MKRVLVLDANQRSALAVVRSLGKHGVPLITADESSVALAGCSRFSQGYFTIPSPGQPPGIFVTAIARLCREQKIDIVLPMIELTVTLLLEYQSDLPGITIPLPDLATFESLTDKCSLMRQAESLDIPAPRTWYADSKDTMPPRLEELPYPLVLKPGKSWLNVQGKWNRNSVQFADNPLDAQTIINSNPALQAHPFLLQACVPGHGAGIFALYDHGRPLAFFAHHRLREKPPRGGVSTLSESVPIDPELLSYTRSLLDAATWHGIAMVEFKVSDNGKAYLMEVNTRFWGSLQLAVDAGIDFPWLLYKLSCGEQLNPKTDYIIGVRLRWLLGDLDNLYLTLKDSNQFSVFEKLKAIIVFFMPSLSRTRHEVNRWSDMRPSWYELKQYIRNLLT